MSPLPVLSLLLSGCWWSALAEDEAPETCTIQGTIDTRGKPRGPVVVYVLGQGPPAEAKHLAVVGQKNKSFDQDAVVVSPGAEVAFPNEDAVHHHLYSHSNHDPFEFAQHAPGARPTRKFDKPGVVRVQCNIHENMETHVLVLPNAWAVQTEEDGSFTIPGVDVGERIVEAWSAWHRPERTTVSCEAGAEVQFDAKLRIRFPGSGLEADGVY